MKLDLDCIRDILLTVEENTGYNKFMVFKAETNEYNLLSNYDNETILYHVMQCSKRALIEIGQRDLSGNILVIDLTPNGHEFLANIRESDNWDKIKKVANDVGTTSLDAVMQIAINVISAIIAAKF